MIAISSENVKTSATGKRKLGLSMTILADPNATVINRYGLRNRNLAIKVIPVQILAIPTTLLVDPEGIVRWVDQAEDFRVRSDAPRVLEAINAL